MERLKAVTERQRLFLSSLLPLLDYPRKSANLLKYSERCPRSSFTKSPPFLGAQS
jgi:hypothetical protein